MVFVSEVSDEVARLTGRDPASMKLISRHLREDGLLSQKGHGRGGAHATPLDAARLLIAGMVPISKLTEAPEVVRHYGSLINISPAYNLDGVPIARRARFEDILADLLKLLAESNGDPNLWGEVELNLSAGRAAILHTNGVLFDGPNPPANIPAAQVRNRIDVGFLHTLARMVDEG